MLGAIVGDIIGSQFEHANHLSKTFDLFTPNCFYSDDTVLTLAVCQALLNTDGQVDHLAAAADKHLAGFANTYWKLSYGSQFNRWRIAEVRTPYFSCGNGSAMRVSGCGFAGHTLDEVLALADAVTAVTHNHPEGLNGARAVAACVFLARTGHDKAAIKTFMERHFYDLSFTLDEIRPTYCRGKMLNTCLNSVPQALQCFFESTSFEDTVRTAVSLGGDSDTLCAIAASIADAYYGCSISYSIPGRQPAQCARYIRAQIPVMTASDSDRRKRH